MTDYANKIRQEYLATFKEDKFRDLSNGKYLIFITVFGVLLSVSVAGLFV